MVTEHVASMVVMFRQAATPANTDIAERAIVVGDFWYDTAAAVYKRCSSISPITFVSIEGGSAAHNVLSATHGDSFSTDTPVDTEVLTWVAANSRWESVAAGGHTQSHAHSAAGDGTTLTPATLNIPNAASPAQTAEGSAVWDSDDDRLTVGTGAGRKTLVNGEDTPGGELGGTYDAPTVDSTHSGSAHHTQSHAHSAAGDGTTLTPATLNIPAAASPAQTADGQAVWDSDDDALTIGDGTSRKTLVNTDRSHDVNVWVSAAAMKGTTTAGAGDANKLPESAETTTNKVNYDYIAFDTTTEENAFFQWRIPAGWNESTITFRFLWTNTGGLTTETVVMGLKGLALSDDDALDTAWGTEVTVTDTWLAQNDVHISAVSAAVTIGGTPAEGDLVMFNLARKTASDNLTGDARILGVVITYTRNSYTD